MDGLPAILGGNKMDSEIVKDKREILGLYFNDVDGRCYEAMHGNLIKAYEEPGPHCYIPFFSVEKNGVIIARLPATMVEVVYKKE